MLNRGFTLIEAAMALAVGATLASLALPSLVDSVRKARRLDAIQRLSEAQLAQERWRAQHLAYTPTLADLGLGEAVARSDYRLRIARAEASGYVLEATPLPGSPQEGDRSCARLVLRAVDGRIVHASAAAGAAERDVAPDPCWQR